MFHRTSTAFRGILTCYFDLSKNRVETVCFLIVRLLRLSGSWYLGLNRTNWTMGRRDINILMLALVIRRCRFRVPLLWSILDHSGNSSTALRMELMQPVSGAFQCFNREASLADREFIGVEWMEFLNRNAIPSAIRVKENFLVIPVHD